MKPQPNNPASLFDDPEDEVSSRILSDEFDAEDGDPILDYAGRAARVRSDDNDW